VVCAPAELERQEVVHRRDSQLGNRVFFEYLFQVPANRIGYTALTLAQLKVLQEMITLSVFVPFALFYMNQPVKLDYLWAALCLVGAAYFMFRG
jgi:uncharacterized protein (DUF486 family)